MVTPEAIPYVQFRRTLQDARINLAENGNITTLSPKQLGHVY